MSSGVRFLVLTGLGLLVVQVLSAAFARRKEVLPTLIHCGPAAATTAIAGAIRLLLVKAETLERVSAVDHHVVVTQGMRLNAHGIARFGSRLFVDDVLVYVIFAIFVVVIVFELRVGIQERGESPAGIGGFVRYALLGFILPLFFGVVALFLVYTRS